MIGQSVAHYEITDELGAGGMGEVYRATDTRLKRQVALKVLPQVFAQDEQRMGRFEREAQVLAAHNHPNIASIFGLEKANGTRQLNGVLPVAPRGGVGMRADNREPTVPVAGAKVPPRNRNVMRAIESFGNSGG